MNIFYKPSIEENTIILDPGESLHCIKVMRYKIGDQVILIDGKGGHYEAEIENEDKKACRIKIVSRQENFEALPYQLHIALAPTKSIDRFEWFVEKATEIGITSITPIICKRSERKNVRIDRIEKLMISAMKQSVKAFLPKIHGLVRYEDWIHNQKNGSRLIAHCMDGEKEEIWRTKLTNLTTVLIGPEGDFTSDELDMAIQNGFQSVTLGKYRLRTETAGVLACSAVYFKMHA